MNDCGCCKGIDVETPARVENRAGLSAIVYRVGTHFSFKDSMLARLAAIPEIRSRGDVDFSIAFLDAWAVVADVLTFYQERIANESYLRTSTERLSLVQLARLIGYRLRPGVAASSYLSFTVESAAGSTGTAIIDVGTKVQSIPGPGEEPQTFETIEKISAQARWNAMKPRLTKPQDVSADMSELLLKGVALKLGKGDPLLIMAPDDSGNMVRKLRRIANLSEDNAAGQTRLTLVGLPSFLHIVNIGQVLAGNFIQGAVTFNTTTIQDQVLNQVWNSANLDAFARSKGFSIDQMYQVIGSRFRQTPPALNTNVFVMRKRASLFGYNAPDWKAMSDSTHTFYPGINNDWSVSNFNTSGKLFLDQVYKEVKPQDWVVVSRPGKEDVITQIASVEETAAADFAMSSQVTAVTLGAGATVSLSTMTELRQTTVYIVPEELAPDELPETGDIQISRIQLDGPVQGLVPGKNVIVTGQRADADGVTDAEAAVISDVELERGYTTLTLLNDLQHPYIRSTVQILGNVALATHGETTGEVLGAGDASQTYQQFTLKQPPLTFISAANETGAASTLKVFVNDVEWHEREHLLDSGFRDRVFIAQTGDDGKTRLEFGDGKTGARLPSGRDNVRAVYRKGIGKRGNVAAGRLSLLMSRPLGVKEVTNPSAASGGDDPEAIEQARGNAPVAVLTLGRIVSLRDYEDFARAFGGITKALATWTWDGKSNGVLITVAGSDGSPVEEGSFVYNNLLTAMQNEGDPFVPIRLQTYVPAYFQLAAKVKLDPDYAANSDKVLASADAALRLAFSFDIRAFGQPVHLSQVIATLQNVPGVVAVDVDSLFRTGATPSAVPPVRLLAAFPQAGSDDGGTAAELLMLDPRPVDLSVMK